VTLLAHRYCAERMRGNDAPIAAKFARARKDPIGILIAACCEYGLRFRWSGAELEIDGLGRLSDRNRVLFHTHEEAILERLAEPGGDGEGLLQELGLWIEMVTTRERAVEVIAELPASCGLDVETCARREFRIEPPWLAITKKGERAKHQPEVKDRSGLDPYKARVRLIQVFSPEHEAVFLFDLDRLPLQVDRFEAAARECVPAAAQYATNWNPEEVERWHTAEQLALLQADLQRLRPVLEELGISLRR
jgi:hypothetical protein